MSDISEFLDHHGVKGMHWGVRKARSRREQAAINARANLKARRRQLSDTDLKQAVERLSTEKKLKDLVDQDLAPGRTVAKKIMSESGQKVARTIIAGAALYAIKLRLEKKFDPKDAAEFLTRGGPKKK